MRSITYNREIFKFSKVFKALANWNPKGVKMQQQNDGTYVIDLQLHLPAYFKFTQGDWDHQLLLTLLASNLLQGQFSAMLGGHIDDGT